MWKNEQGSTCVFVNFKLEKKYVQFTKWNNRATVLSSGHIIEQYEY